MRIQAMMFLVGMLLAPSEAMTLEGAVEKSDVEGRIGVRISGCGRIGKVHACSPAAVAGLRKNDQVVLVDGKKNNVAQISGEPGTLVELEVKRQGERFAVQVERVDFRHIDY